MTDNWEPPKRGEYEADARNDPDEHYQTEDAPVTTFEPVPITAQEPIPVFIINPDPPIARVGWSANRSQIGQDAVMIAGARTNRKRLLIQNEGGGAVYIGPTAEAVKADDTAGALGFGYKLNVAANYVVELTHNSAVWARTATGDSAKINVIEEFFFDSESAIV